MPSEVEASLKFFESTQTSSRFQTPKAQHPTLNETLAGGGARTHTALRPLDFESSASANSATPALEDVTLQIQWRSSSNSFADAVTRCWDGSNPPAIYCTVVSHLMKSSSVRRVLSLTTSTTLASSMKPRNGVLSGIKSNGSTRYFRAATIHTSASSET